MTWRVLLVVLCCSALAFGEEPDPSELEGLEGLLDTGVVSAASRAQERTEDAPATITVVTSDDFRRYGLRTVGDAINFLSVGLVSQDPLHAIEVGSRGVLFNADYGNHVLLLIDGHMMNEQWNGTAYFEQGLGVPLEFIDHVELIVGPGSVLYGSSAMLAVVNVVTKRSRDLGGVSVVAEGALSPPQDVNGNVRLPDASNFLGGAGRVSLLAGHETTLAGRSLELSFAAEYFAHHGQSLTFGVQEGLAERWGARSPGPGTWGGTTKDAWWTQAPSALIKVRWGDFTLWVSGSIYSRGSPAYDQLGAAADFDASNTERDRFLNLELSWARTLSPRFRLLVRGYADSYDYLASSETSSWSTYGEGPAPTDLAAFLPFHHEMRASSHWAGLETQGTIDWLGDGRFPLMLGVDARLRHFDDTTEGRGHHGEPLYTANEYAANEWQVGVYAQQRARLLPTLQLNAGARVDLQAMFAARVSPRVALVWTLPWQGRLKALFNSAYRAPSGYERYSEYSSYQVRNPDLRPETVFTGELSYEQRVGRHRFFLGGFVSSFQHMVQFVLVDGEEGLWRYENHGTLLNAGANAKLEGAFGKFGYGLSFTGAQNVTEEPLVASPGWFGNARVSYDFGEGLPRVSLLSAFSGERLITTAYAAGAAGETWDPSTRVVSPQVELRGAVQAPLPLVKGLWVRGVVGGQVMPFSAYTVGPRQVPEGEYVTPAQAPNSRLFVMLTLGWSLDPK